MEDQLIERIGERVKALTEIPHAAGVCADARAGTTEAMLRFLLQHLVDRRIIDGPALASLWQNHTKEPHLDDTAVPQKIWVQAQAVSDRAAAAFLNDLLRQSGDPSKP